MLVFESHPDTSTYLGIYLRLLGYQVSLVASADAAAVELAGAWYDVVIAEQNPPDGVALVLPPAGGVARLPLAIAMTEVGDPADRLRSQSAGYHYQLRKPFDPEVLRLILESAVQPGGAIASACPQTSSQCDNRK